MKILPKLIISPLCLLLFISISSSVWAIPMVEITYHEKNNGDGTFQYDYNIANKSDPIEDAGFDIFEIFFSFDNTVAATVLSVADGWSYITGIGFIDAYSDFPGAPPEGTDIGPGMSNNEFSFVFDQQIGAIAFEASIWDSTENEFGPVYAGAASAVPEPATVILIISGLLGMGLFRRENLGN